MQKLDTYIYIAILRCENEAKIVHVKCLEKNSVKIHLNRNQKISHRHVDFLC